MEMRLNSSRENKGIKQEDQQTRSLSSLRQRWSNPRIVRVSRTFGGKDRHSKVCTVRGLRDRRIRLSVTTAIQLYDLQHRLGLSQPSKVVDWLLEAAKNDVDVLPPLQLLPWSLRTGNGINSINPNLTDVEESNFPGIFETFDLGSCSSRTQTEHLELEKRKWDKFDKSRGFDIDHHYFWNSMHSSKLYFPTSSNNSYHYNLGHLQQSLLDQSGNVTVASSSNSNTTYNNIPNAPAVETTSFLFPRYHPSFLDGGQLQLFSENSNSSKQTDHVE